MALPANPNANMFNATWASLVAAQTFNVTDATGEVDTYSFDMLDAFMSYVGKTLIISGVSIGMTFVLIVILLLLTKPEKRRTPVFVLNLLALFMQFLRMILSATWWNGPTENISNEFLDINVLVSNSTLWSLYLFAICSIAWYFVILTSMVLQVRVVFAADPKMQKIVTAMLALLGLATFGVVMPVQIQSIITTSGRTGILPRWWPVLMRDGHILWAITIGISSLIFVSKLLYLIHKRKAMGFKGFGPLQVITIMGTQCLIIPRNHTDPSPESLTDIQWSLLFSTFTLTSTALSLLVKPSLPALFRFPHSGPPSKLPRQPQPKAWPPLAPSARVLLLAALSK